VANAVTFPRLLRSRGSTFVRRLINVNVANRIKAETPPVEDAGADNTLADGCVVRLTLRARVDNGPPGNGGADNRGGGGGGGGSASVDNGGDDSNRDAVALRCR